MDGDGDLDLAAWNVSGSPGRVYLNHRIRPSALAPGLPDHAPHATFPADDPPSQDPATGLVTVPYVLFDAEGDLANIAPRFTFEGGISYPA